MRNAIVLFLMMSIPVAVQARAAAGCEEEPSPDESVKRYEEVSVSAKASLIQMRKDAPLCSKYSGHFIDKLAAMQTRLGEYSAKLRDLVDQKDAAGIRQLKRDFESEDDERGVIGLLRKTIPNPIPFADDMTLDEALEKAYSPDRRYPKCQPSALENYHAFKARVQKLHEYLGVAAAALDSCS